MNTLSVENFGMSAMSESELVTIDGGHEGTAYGLGWAVGRTVKQLGALFFFL